MPKLTGTIPHAPTGKVMHIDWEYEDTGGAHVEWKYRLRYGGKLLEEKEGGVDFNQFKSNAAAAALDHITSVINSRAALYKLG